MGCCILLVQSTYAGEGAHSVCLDLLLLLTSIKSGHFLILQRCSPRPDCTRQSTADSAATHSFHFTSSHTKSTRFQSGRSVDFTRTVRFICRVWYTERVSLDIVGRGGKRTSLHCHSTRLWAREIAYIQSSRQARDGGTEGGE